MIQFDLEVAMGYGRGPAYRLSAVDRRELLRRVRAGETHRMAPKAVGCSAKSVQRLLRRTGGVRGRERPGRSGHGLSWLEREEISQHIAAGQSRRHIARHLGRAPSPVSREVAANGGLTRYRAWHAEESARRAAARPKRAKLASCRRLRRVVELRLRQRWSPQQIAARLRAEYPEDRTMQVSHETIYQSLFVQGSRRPSARPGGEPALGPSASAARRGGPSVRADSSKW